MPADYTGYNQRLQLYWFDGGFGIRLVDICGNMGNTTLIATSSAGSEGFARLSLARILAILRASAVKAFVTALLVTVLGQVALGIIGDLLIEMTPALPPWGAAEPESQARVVWGDGWSSLGTHGFGILTAVFFVGFAGTRLAGYSTSPRIRNAAAGLARISRRVSDHWFGSIVGNAFYAMVLVFGLCLAQELSASRWLVTLLFDFLHPATHTLAGFFLGADTTDGIGRLLGWWNDNQVKFVFWSLYLAAIGDDLGLPNYKTLGRILWRRLRDRCVNRAA